MGKTKGAVVSLSSDALVTKPTEEQVKNLLNQTI